MKPFDFEAQIDNVYQSYPSFQQKPLIGITTDFADINATIRECYYQQVVQAGGIPVLIPPINNTDVILNTLEHIDALILTGGGDVNPLWSNEDPIPTLGHVNDKRDLPELLITRLAFNQQIPILGICRGMQIMATALGGKVIQHLQSNIKHTQEAERNQLSHSITIETNSILHDIYQTNQLFVNSFHHQAVIETGVYFKVTATANDGIIEAIESTEHKSLLGVQWHPEWLEAQGLKLFQWLTKQAATFSAAKKLHQKILTLDTHCDTPMLFAQDIRFEQRDKHILVDLHKMTEGKQDAAIMVAYLPQLTSMKAFSQNVGVETTSHFAYTNWIFDKIEHIVNQQSNYLSIAKTPAQLQYNKQMGKKSIVLGIENGLAIEDNIEHVAHFAKRGVTYITLCHNGDNNICDSCRSSNTHNGVSPFGEKVIQKMNDCGIMVDLSHASEKSFYDALDISSTPIVCSHSSSKALCDVARNLTDEQYRALSKAGGVAHTTFYHGFLRKGGNEASIIDGINHLEHAIKIMGIDHVGIGTDFDGDGGVCGLANSSELINFTIQLLRRRYSEEDIAKIWGGNWLRVMQTVQDTKKI